MNLITDNELDLAVDCRCGCCILTGKIIDKKLWLHCYRYVDSKEPNIDFSLDEQLVRTLYSTISHFRSGVDDKEVIIKDGKQCLVISNDCDGWIYLNAYKNEKMKKPSWGIVMTKETALKFNRKLPKLFSKLPPTLGKIVKIKPWTELVAESDAVDCAGHLQFDLLDNPKKEDYLLFRKEMKRFCGQELHIAESNQYIGTDGKTHYTFQVLEDDARWFTFCDKMVESFH